MFEAQKQAKKMKGEITAWVIGLGSHPSYKREDWNPKPTEHLELAHSLNRAGIKKFMIFASDKQPEIIKAAEKQLSDKEISIPKEQQVFPKENKISQYLNKKVLRFDKQKNAVLSTSKKLRKKIVLLGPPKTAGDVFLESPVKRPNLIMCNNVLYYHEEREEEIVRNITRALAPGGILIIDSISHNGVKELLKKSGLALQKLTRTHAVYKKREEKK